MSWRDFNPDYIFSCEDCVNLENGECKKGLEMLETQDAYDCVGFTEKE